MRIHVVNAITKSRQLLNALKYRKNDTKNNDKIQRGLQNGNNKKCDGVFMLLL